MDLWTAVAVLMLVVWGVVTFALAPAPGWVHGLLTAGVFLLIYRAVVRGTTPRTTGGATRGPERSTPRGGPASR
jgi:uncharacterized protein (DUF58 family)